MSVHKSKGLDFPVVFLADTARRFNKQDLTEGVLVHPELGLGPKLTDVGRGVEFPTAARTAISKRLGRENLSEEMRILYVAMTRARERLIITCAFKKPEEVVLKLRRRVSSPIAPQVLEACPLPPIGDRRRIARYRRVYKAREVSPERSRRIDLRPEPKIKPTA
jgi:ATP-dependent helicase/nuclease subunit A